MKKLIWIAALLALSQTGWATSTFNLIPVNGFLTGQPGETIGWGFTLTNDTDYLVVTGSVFTQLTGVGIGSYTDIISTEFFPVGPATTITWSQNFDNSLPTGTGSFTINPAVPFETITGRIDLTYDLYSDPGATVFVSSGAFTDELVTIEVVPEPATLGLAGGALLLFALRRKLTRR
jgi:hypothetical protein